MKLKSKISYFAVFFWLCQVVLFYALVIFQDWPIWSVGFAPVYCVIYPLTLKTTSYTFCEDKLVVSGILSKTVIEYTQMGKIMVKDSNIAQQLLGFPRRIVSLEYNRFDSVIILNASPRMLRKLLRESESSTIARTA